MELKKPINVTIGPIKGALFGGPFRAHQPTRRLFSINMAKEIPNNADFRIPTRDFSVPEVEDMEAGLMAALNALQEGNDIYVGCMGGVGRTGLFLGCFAKVLKDCDKAGLYPVTTVYDPVLWVRDNYKSHAIETPEQEAFVRNFPTEAVLSHLHSLLYVPQIPKTASEAFFLWLRLLFN